MLKIVLGNSEFIYILKKGDLEVTYSISFKAYFELSKMYDDLFNHKIILR